MFPKLRFWWQEIGSSFWFVPALLVIAGVALAIVLVAIDAEVQFHFDRRWPLAFGAGAAGSRGLLMAVASSMITVAGVVFSITIVALSLTSSQYTSRVLRNFMRDYANQAVLGVFVGIFAYCLVVLRTIREGDEGEFVPSLAVLGGLGLTFVGIGFLIFFIHHISMSIQASSIIAAAALETKHAIDHLFPEGIGDSGEDEIDVHLRQHRIERPWTAVAAPLTGYIENIDGEGLMAFARKWETVLRMEYGVGDFVIEGTTIVSAAGLSLSREQIAELNGRFVIARQRTVQQDAGFGLRQIVDIALKALSPGVNDSTTAVMCVDYLNAVLVQLAQRRIASPCRLDEGQVRLITRGPTFQSLVAEAFDQIRQSARGNVAVLSRLLRAFESIATATRHKQRLQCIRQHAEAVWAIAEFTVMKQDLVPLKATIDRLRLVIDM